MKQRLAWLAPILCLIVASGCTRRATVATATPVFVRPADPAPIVVPGAPTAPSPATSGYFGPGSGCNSCPSQQRPPVVQPQPGAQPFPTAPPVQQSQFQAPQPAPSAPPPANTPPPLANTAPPQVQLSPPEPQPPANRTPEPPRASTLPAGIPQFGSAREGVAAGLRPLEDGFDWLQSNGYKTVLHVRLPGEDDTQDRASIEKRGMKYLSLEVSPQTLQRKTLDDFIALVTNAGSQPMFVYDRDGALAGALWYGYFRLAEMQPDDAARIRAGALGLRETRMGQHLDMWLALQKVFSEK